MSTLDDGERMAQRISQTASSIPQRLARGMYRELGIELTETKKRCPVSPTLSQLKAMGRSRPKNVVPGALRASGRVTEPVITRNEVSAAITYGNASVTYAVIQHERTDFFHVNGEAKYVESVLNESRPHMANRVGRHVHFDKVL